METKKGTPVAIVKIWTDDLKVVLTAAMGDADTEVLQITTTKDLSDPAGTFSIVLVPRTDANGQTWFEKLDAFDYVEIEFQGINDSKSHIVMRGLIDRVMKTENWEGGVPERTITVTGRDLASIFLDHGIYFMPELGGKYAKEALPQVGVIAWPTVAGNYEKISTVARAFEVIIGRLESILNLTFGNGQIGLVDKLECTLASTFPNNITSYSQLEVYQGSFWQALQYYQDKPFHEMFLYDDDKHTNLILRPARLKDAMGNYHKSVNDLISQTVMYPKDWTFSDVDMVQSTLEKNHNEVFNYYLTSSSVMILEKFDMRGIELDLVGGDPTLTTNPFFQMDPNLPAYIGKYGFRKYEGSTVFRIGHVVEDWKMIYEPSPSPTPSGAVSDVGQIEGPNSTRGKSWSAVVAEEQSVKQIRERNKIVVAWFLHNEHLLSGNIDIAGTNQAIIGTYVKNTSDNMEYYVEGVTHSFVQFRSFRTSLRVTRGMPSSDKYGLVGLSEYKYSKFNRFYFNEGGVWDTSPPEVPAPITIQEEGAIFGAQMPALTKQKQSTQKIGKMPPLAQNHKTIIVNNLDVTAEKIIMANVPKLSPILEAGGFPEE